MRGPRRSDGCCLRLGLGLVFGLRAFAAATVSARTDTSFGFPLLSTSIGFDRVGAPVVGEDAARCVRTRVERDRRSLLRPFFNGVDWNEVHTRYKPLVEAAKDDREFYSLMSRMTGELHDAHTRFNSPEQWRNIKKQQGVGSGLSLDEIDGKIVVTSIRPDSNAAHVGIEPGMIVLVGRWEAGRGSHRGNRECEVGVFYESRNANVYV